MPVLPSGTISILTTLMSEGDLNLLQWAVQVSQESLPPEMVEKAYNVARELHPEAPSLKELLAWDRQGPLRETKEPSPEMDDLPDLLDLPDLQSE